MEYEENKWFLKQPEKNDRLRIFCFPYAGAGGSVYKNWSYKEDQHVGVCPIQYPGRENRLFEPPIQEMDLLVSEICAQIRKHLDCPYLLFGHSLGAKVAFRVASAMQKTHGTPAGLIVAGARAPHISETNPICHLDDDKIIEELRRLGGTPDEILNNKEIMKLFLPSIRADYTLADCFVCKESRILDCSLMAVTGEYDQEATREEMDKWKGYTKKNFTHRAVRGDHFFIEAHEKELLGMIADEYL